MNMKGHEFKGSRCLRPKYRAAPCSVSRSEGGSLLCRLGKQSSHDLTQTRRVDWFSHDGIDGIRPASSVGVGRNHENGLSGRHLFDATGQFIAFDKRQFKVNHHEVEVSCAK